MKVRFYLGIGLNNCDQEEVVEIDDSEVINMNEKKLEEYLDEQLNDWAANYLDLNWSIEK